MKKNSCQFVQLFRYMIAGGTAFVLDFSLLWFCTEKAGINYLISTVIGYSVGLIVSYLMSILWVFDQRRIRNVALELGGFTLIGLIGVGLTSLLMWLQTDKLGLYYLFSKITTTAIVFFWNFAAKKTILFTRRTPDESETHTGKGVAT